MGRLTGGGITRRTLAALPLAALPLAGTARAQEAWPSRPIRIVVPYSPGGGTDLVTRSLAEAARAALGQPVLVENRPGANGVVGSEAVARAEPDGYLLLVVTSGHVPLRYTVPNLPFHPVRDFTSVALLSRFPVVLVASTAAPFADAAGMLAYARANPGRLSYGTTTAANSFAAQDFARQAGLVMTEVPYRGAGPMLPDVMAGHLSLAWASPESARAQMGSGRLRIIGHANAQPSVLLPGVPSLAQVAGLPGFDHPGWYGMFAPPKLPEAIRQRLAAAIAGAAAPPAMQARLHEMGMDGVVEPPERFAALLERDDARWAAAAAQGLLRGG